MHNICFQINYGLFINISVTQLYINIFYEANTFFRSKKQTLHVQRGVIVTRVVTLTCRCLATRPSRTYLIVPSGVQPERPAPSTAPRRGT